MLQNLDSRSASLRSHPYVCMQACRSLSSRWDTVVASLRLHASVSSSEKFSRTMGRIPTTACKRPLELCITYLGIGFILLSLPKIPL